MLLLLLVLGPFILLLLFGAGYKDTTIKLRTEFVGPEGSLYEDAISDYSDQLDEYIDIRGFTADEQAARRDLEQGRLDAVVVFPPDALDQILSGQSAKITVLHDTLDPFQQVAIDVSSRLAVQEVNASVLGSIVAETQDAMAPAAQTASVLTEQAATLTQAAEGGDAATIAQAAGTVADTLADARVVVATSQQVIEQLDGAEDSSAINELLASLESAEAEANAISADGGATTAEQAAQLGGDAAGGRRHDGVGHRPRSGRARAPVRGSHREHRSGDRRAAGLLHAGGHRAAVAAPRHHVRRPLARPRS